MHVNPHHKSDSDLQLELKQIVAAKQDPARFNVLYEKYYKPIFVFTFRRMGDEELTADITSQVFLKALINIRKFEYRGVPFSAWLFRIAYNEINMYFRKNNSNRIVSIDQPGMIQIAAEVELEKDTEGLQKMTNALKQLDMNDLHLIELRFFEKHSFAEIGEIIGVSEGNAKIKTYRILEKLKKIMNKMKTGDPWSMNKMNDSK